MRARARVVFVFVLAIVFAGAFRFAVATFFGARFVVFIARQRSLGVERRARSLGVMLACA